MMSQEMSQVHLVQDKNYHTIEERCEATPAEIYIHVHINIHMFHTSHI